MLLAKNNSLSSLLGIGISLTIIALWLTSLILFWQLDVVRLPWILIVVAMGVRTFLHTGLFIVVHDSIHGVVSMNHKINNLMGYLAAFLYALLPYQTLANNHHQHHRYPATEKDPDYYQGESQNFWLWYGSFMKHYQKGKQFWILFWGMTIIFWSLIALHIAIPNIFLFWVIPIILSSLQLFVFGIFLPHRQSDEEHSDRHRARSSNYSVFWSFISCYHFGYHWEHHQYPYLPWYQLPSARQTNSPPLHELKPEI